MAFSSGTNSSGERSVESLGTHDGRLIALDAVTGRPCLDFGHQGSVNLREGAADAWPDAHYGITSPPAIYKDLVITGAAVPGAFPLEAPAG